MQTVTVSELKARLSGYLAQVRRGATVTVCDRRTPIARLVPCEGDAGGLEVREPVDVRGLPAATRIALRKPVDPLYLDTSVVLWALLATGDAPPAWGAWG